MSSINDFVRADSSNLPDIDISVILEHFTTSDKHNVAEIRGVKTLMASRNGYVQNAVGYVEIKRDNTRCTVRAKVVPEHKVTKKYYMVTVHLNEKDNTIIDTECDGCPASAATGEWERLACRGEPPPSLQEHSCTAHNNKLYVFGGEPGALGDTPLWVYDAELGTWRKLPGQPAALGRRASMRASMRGAASPRGRRGHSAHALKDCLLVFGGYKDLRGSTNELWAFHYETESWHQVRTANAGPARHRHAGALHDARLYVHAGQSDLRACADLWHYDTLSRVWTQVRAPRGRPAPSARAGHAGLRAGAHLYIFGGEADGHPTNELWRFHFATETWERIIQSVNSPSPRVDCCALLVPGAPRRLRSAPAPAPAPVTSRPDPPASLLKELSRLSSIHMRRAARCSYSALGQDSTESLALSKSHSAYVIERTNDAEPREADEAERFRSDISREPISVPDFADMILPTPVLSPVEATKLVYLDSDEEEDMKREIESMRKKDDDVKLRRLETPKVVALSKSASVRFSKDVTSTEEEGESSTSDYASAERVNRLSGASLGFCNPHYLGPDVRALAALTPDSGVGAGDIELQDLGEKRSRSAQRNGDTQLHLLLVGGREAPHVDRLQSPLSLWTYRLL